MSECLPVFSSTVTLPTVSVLIPSHRRPGLLARTLASLADESRLDLVSDIHVVENGEQFGAEAVVEAAKDRLPGIHYAFEPLASVSLARNIAVQQATGELLIFLDDDIRTSGILIEAYTRAARVYGTDCFFGGALGVDYEKEPEPWLIPYLPKSARGFDLGPHDVLVDVPIFLGGNFAAPAVAVHKVGGFDEKFGSRGTGAGALGEESDLQARLLGAGYRGIYLPKAFVWHYVPHDRCTFDWLVQRYHRAGRTEGCQEALKGDASRLLIWVRRRQMLWRLRWLWAACRGPAARVARGEAELELSRLLGLVEGLCGKNG